MTSKQPDIIFIVLDTHRADRMGSYGYEARETGRSITPNLDQFAGQSALFTNAVSPAQWTIPSHASMFTGLYPTAHQVTQSNRSLGPDRPHLAEVLQSAGYQTIGFCNNPLVGILNNGFKRGFQTFYNYGGAFPSVPQQSTSLPWPFNAIVTAYTQFLRRISYPIQNFFGRSDLAFRVSLNAWLTPLWSKMANFKGQNERSARDIKRFLVEREKSQNDKPLFLFLNLMETHLPFWPPGEFVDQVAPYMRSNKEARDVMRRWNKEAYRWGAPLSEPLGELESQVLNDMYDAEVAYQDNYLGPLFKAIQERANADNTLTVIVADHGDGLGEHGCFGHAFVAYQELVHVPLMINWPRRIPKGNQVESAVSTRRIYHTILDAVGMLPESVKNLDPAEVHGLTLMENVLGRNPEQSAAFSEVYPPHNFVKVIQHRQPELLEQYRCLEMRRAVVKDGKKLIHISHWPDELFDLDKDPLEMENSMEQHPAETAQLSQEINRLARVTEAQRDNLAAGLNLEVEIDEHLLQRLRGLGYIE